MTMAFDQSPEWARERMSAAERLYDLSERYGALADDLDGDADAHHVCAALLADADKLDRLAVRVAKGTATLRIANAYTSAAGATLAAAAKQITDEATA